MTTPPYYRTAERPPTEAYPSEDHYIFAFLVDGSPMWVTRYASTVRAHPLKYTHWFEMPPAPKSAEDEAFEAAFYAWRDAIPIPSMNYGDTFRSGWAAAKAHFTKPA